MARGTFGSLEKLVAAEGRLGKVAIEFQYQNRCAKILNVPCLKRGLQVVKKTELPFSRARIEVNLKGEIFVLLVVVRGHSE